MAHIPAPASGGATKSSTCGRRPRPSGHCKPGLWKSCLWKSGLWLPGLANDDQQRRERSYLEAINTRSNPQSPPHARPFRRRPGERQDPRRRRRQSGHGWKVLNRRGRDPRVRNGARPAPALVKTGGGVTAVIGQARGLVRAVARRFPAMLKRVDTPPVKHSIPPVTSRPPSSRRRAGPTPPAVAKWPCWKVLHRRGRDPRVRNGPRPPPALVKTGAG